MISQRLVQGDVKKPWARNGDWQCPNTECKNSEMGVFASKDTCPSCGAQKPSPHMIETKNGPRPATTANAKIPKHASPGDWSCPNEICNNHLALVFSRHANCPACGASKPAHGMVVSEQQAEYPAGSMYAGKGGKASGGKGGGKSSAQQWGQQQWNQGGDSWGGDSWGGDDMASNLAAVMSLLGMPMPAKGGYGKAKGGKDKGGKGGGRDCGRPSAENPSGGNSTPWAKAGDWQCPNSECKNHHTGVFGTKMNCPSCGSDKPEPPPPHTKPGDWPCPNQDCKNAKSWVFAKYDACPTCFQPKPVGTMATFNEVTAKPWLREGDWHCPNTECKNHETMVFGSKNNCPSCGADKPGSALGRSGPY